MSALRKPTAAELELLETEAMFARVLGEQWRDPKWRLRNLYWIIDEDGQRCRFIPNEEQDAFGGNLWFRNLILKARQLGFSTYMAILELDQALFNANYKGVIISDTLPNAGKLFAKVEFAYSNLPEEVRAALPLKQHASKSVIEFVHGSSVTVSVSPRGDTLQILHVSELGKISRKFPARAEEIVSGGFPTVPKNGVIVVESTAEGAAGEFYDLVKPALDRMREGRPETQLDWRLHFFPWFTKASYRLSDADTKLVHIDENMVRYFRELEAKHGIKTDANQRAWYVKMRETQKKKMKREFPSTPEEAFEAAVEGAIYGDEMTVLRENGRLTQVAIDPTYPVNTFWDLGSANTFIWLHQRVGLQDRFVKCFGGRKTASKGIGRWWREIEKWRLEWAIDDSPFLWGKHYMPHDAETDIQGDENKDRKTLFEEAGGANVVVVPRIQNLDDGIEMLRRVLDVRVWIDRDQCSEGWAALDAYQNEWDDIRGTWKDTPLHNWASHPCDAIRQYAQADNLGLIGGGKLTQSVTKLKRRERSWR